MDHLGHMHEREVLGHLAKGIFFEPIMMFDFGPSPLIQINLEILTSSMHMQSTRYKNLMIDRTFIACQVVWLGKLSTEMHVC